MAEVTEKEILKVTDQLTELRSNLEQLTKELSRNNKVAADNIISSVKEQVEDIEKLKERSKRMQEEFGELAEKTKAEAKSIRQSMDAEADALRRSERRIELDRTEALEKLQKKRKEDFKKQTEDIDKLLKEQVRGGRKLQDEIVKRGNRLEEISKKRTERLSKTAKKNIQTVNKALRDGARSGFEFVKGLQSVAQELAVFAVLKPELGLPGLLKTQISDAMNIDDAIRKVAASTGMSFKFIEDAYKRAQFNAAGVEGMLDRIGLSPEETAAATEALINSTDIFRRAITAKDRDTAALLVNQTGALKKLGVEGAKSSKNLDIFNRVLGKGGKQSLALNRQLVGIARGLNINVSKAFEDFGSQVNFLASFGDRATDVFAGLAATARATGVEISELGKLVEKLDTQKGASEFAARLNALFGETIFNASEITELMGQDKILFILQRLEATGVRGRIGAMGQREAMLTRRVLGEVLGSVETAQRFLQGDNLKEIATGLEQARDAADQEFTPRDLEKSIRDSMTAEQLAMSARQELARSAHKVSQQMRKSVINANNAIRKSIQNVTRDLGHNETAFLGIAAAVTGLEGPVNALSKSVVALKGFKAIAAGFGVGLIGGEGAGMLDAELQQSDKGQAAAKKLENLIRQRNRTDDSTERGKKLRARRTERIQDEIKRLERKFLKKRATDVDFAADQKSSIEDRRASLADLQTKLQKRAREAGSEGGTAITEKEGNLIEEIINKIIDAQRGEAIQVGGQTINVELQLDGRKLADATVEATLEAFAEKVQAATGG